MATRYILAVLACGFVTAGILSLTRDGGRRHPQTRAWLLIGAIFGAVSAWLWSGA